MTAGSTSRLLKHLQIALFSLQGFSLRKLLTRKKTGDDNQNLILWPLPVTLTYLGSCPSRYPTLISEDYGDRLGHRHFYLYWRLFPQVAPVFNDDSNIAMTTEDLTRINTFEGPWPRWQLLHESKSEV